MNLREEIKKQREKIISTLSSLINIESVLSSAKKDMPFGEGINNAFLYMLDLAKKNNFRIKNIKNYGGHFDFEDETSKNYEKKILAIAVHLDTVPGGKNWEETEPFSAVVRDEKIFGRGAIDNKGPTIASYYAIKLLKDAGFRPKNKIRFIMGLDEETGWVGMDKYLAEVKPPDFAIVPDANFPLVFAEKGILEFQFAKKLRNGNGEGVIISSIKGGTVANAVPAESSVILSGISKEELLEKAKIFNADNKDLPKLEVKGVGKSLKVTAFGKAAHAAKPELGTNAISILFKFLSLIELENDDLALFVKFYNEKIAFQHNGENLSLNLKDKPSGKLTLNPGLISVDKNIAILTINLRYPVSSNTEEIYDILTRQLERTNIGIVKLLEKTPLYKKLDNPLIEALLEVYREETGDEISKPISIGGGTFARAFPNAVSFGPTFPNQIPCEHQKDEFISITHLLSLINIYAKAIQKLDAIL